MSIFLSIKNSTTNKEIFEFPIIQSGKPNKRGNWLMETLEKNAVNGVVITSTIQYTPKVSFLQDCNWIINHLKKNAETVSFEVS